MIAVSAILFTACNNGGSKNKPAGQDMNNMNKDTMQPASTPEDKDVKIVSVTYTNVDANAAASIKEIINHYLHIKNALANDNGADAASGAREMGTSINKLDKSLLTAEQKKVYDNMEEELREHAEHIGNNGDKIEHQRTHFSQLSEIMYDLVKAFGAGQPMYHEHCPMYNKDKGGAMWLSEMKEIKNPYFGAAMPTCGTVEEVIK